jgi:hypothetical protein
MKRERSRSWSTSSAWAIGAAALASAVLTTGAAPAQAGGSPRSCKALVGTYLITNVDADGSIDSRSLVVFSTDGAFQFIDSNQAGVPGEFAQFTDAVGRWSCARQGRKRTAQVVALDFTLSTTPGPDQQIARLDFFDVTVDRRSGDIEGQATLRFFPIACDPLDPPSNTAEPFSFRGQRVVVDPAQSVD